MRLEDVIADLARIRDAIGAAGIAAGYVATSAFGGVVAHLRAAESERQAQGLGGQFRSMLRRTVVAGFVGLLLYFLFAGWGQAASPWGFFCSGVAALYASEALDLLWFLARRRIKAMTGVDLKKGPDDGKQ